jgi:hypothetical protein
VLNIRGFQSHYCVESRKKTSKKGTKRKGFEKKSGKIERKVKK